MQPNHLRRVAAIHAAALAGDFLPSLGESFLRIFYQAALQSDSAFGFVLLDQDTPNGFVLGSADTRRLFSSVLRKAALPLGIAALPAVLRKPGLLAKVFETFFYPQREAGTPENAELVVIAVDAEIRSHGVGHALIRALEAEFRQQGVSAYKVTVLQSNTGANRFYQREGFHLASQFNLYNKGWNQYTRSLGEPTT
jgi:ribosomal protein S18 acetylase RimI-like enzyme